MRKAILTAVATIAITIIPMLTAGLAQAACQCPGLSGPSLMVCQATGAMPGGGVADCGITQLAPQPTTEASQPQAPQQAPEPAAPQQAPEREEAPSQPPGPAPSTNLPTTTVKPATATTTPNAPSTKPIALPTPKDVSASPDAVQAAKNAPAATIDPANPPPPPAGKTADVAETVQQNRQSTVQHWGFVDYDTSGQPVLFNPVGVDMTFRYFYQGSYRDVFIPAGGRVVLTTATAGVFPFTAVGTGYVTSGYFTGGDANPVVLNDVNVHVVAVNTTLVVNKVTVVGHDADAPEGQQDIMLLDATTLARGQINQATDGGAVDLVAAQSTPGVGPWDNGASIVNTALQAAPDDEHYWLLIGAGLTVAVLVLAGVVLIWIGVARRQKRAQPPTHEGWQ